MYSVNSSVSKVAVCDDLGQVYERAVQATPMSVEVWIAYIHLRITHKNTGDKTSEELASLNAEYVGD